MSKIQRFGLIQGIREFIRNNYETLTRIGLFFLLGLAVLCIGAVYTTDASYQDGSWREKSTHLLNTAETRQFAEKVLLAYQTQDVEFLQQAGTASVAYQLSASEEDKSALQTAVIHMFGGEAVLSETALSDIQSFINTIYQSEVSSWQIQDIHIKDNRGRVAVTLSMRPKPAVISGYSLSDVVSRATSEYSEAHREELVQLYLNTGDETAITRVVIDNIYPQILEHLTASYQKEFTTDVEMVMMVEKDSNGEPKVTELIFPEQTM